MSTIPLTVPSQARLERMEQPSAPIDIDDPPEPDTWSGPFGPLAPLRFVALGGVAGATVRWALLLSFGAGQGAPVLAAVNVAGSILLGLFIGLHLTRGGRQRLDSEGLLLGGAGFCGALTDFAGFSVQVARALDQGQVGRAAAIAFGTAGLALVGAGVGWRVGSRP